MSADFCHKDGRNEHGSVKKCFSLTVAAKNDRTPESDLFL